jgi:hypothetical protein
MAAFAILKSLPANALVVVTDNRDMLLNIHSWNKNMISKTTFLHFVYMLLLLLFWRHGDAGSEKSSNTCSVMLLYLNEWHKCRINGKVHIIVQLLQPNHQPPLNTYR